MYRFHLLCFRFEQMDEMLMAKEAEKADLMKQRQKLREQLAPASGGGLTGDELERVRLEKIVALLQENAMIGSAFVPFYVKI